jgi:membrane fusion protein
MTLFRPEVLEAKRLQRYGRTVPLYSGATLPITLVLLFGVIVVTVWLVTGSFARTQLVEGWIVPNGPMANIQPMQPGQITSIAVKEGRLVRAGQQLATLSLQSANSASANPAAQSLDILARQGSEIANQVGLARASAREDSSRLAATVQASAARLDTVAEQITIQRQKVDSARKSFAIITRAEREKAINRIDYENQRRALLAEEAELQRLVAEQASLRAENQQASADLRQIPIRLEERLAELRGTGIEIEKQRLSIGQGSSAVLTAPFDGVVGVVQAKVGQTIAPGQPVMQILGANTRLEAEVYAPTRAIGFASVGQEVRLMYDAFP